MIFMFKNSLIIKILRIDYKTNHLRQMSTTLESLKFDNKALKSLPIDPIGDNYVRTVANACFSRVKPTPLSNPRLVVYSKSALKLIDIEENEIKRKEFSEYFSGNQLLPGSETAAHCYCGHQFGTFAGQLGDGAAIYLGEIINSSGHRWELQLKGGGLTPYSRDADGRKVLRSSIREFLCSEAMHYLGIPTTRAATCIASDDKVIRDMFYTGDNKQETCSVISRIAPTFIRFGSFEIFKTLDPMTGRRGPSVGRTDILTKLTDYVIQTFFEDIESQDIPKNEKYKMFYKQVVTKTAETVALWQTVGFCHGVLNTDNMSIIGLTLDYGPFGFMDRFDWDHVCNSSDDSGRYTYVKQPEICKWNLFKFAEALQPLIPLNESKEILETNYYKTFNTQYTQKMLKKFGLFESLSQTNDQIVGDEELIHSFLDTMDKTGADFTNCFRSLNLLSICGLSNHRESVDQLREQLLSKCSSLEEIIAANESSFDSREFQLFLVLMQTNPQLLEMLGKGPKAIERVIAKIDKNNKLKEMNSEQKKAEDIELWNLWIDKYVKRIESEVKHISNNLEELEKYNKKRIKIMNENNPKYVLRNYLAKEATDKAEIGDFTPVNNLFRVLQNPYNDSDVNDGKDYWKRPPEWACQLKVSCSS